MSKSKKVENVWLELITEFQQWSEDFNDDEKGFKLSLIGEAH